jgi:hypothetical protein
MFGRLDQSLEHNLVPILKIIDFGLAGVVNTRDIPLDSFKRKFDDELELDR